MKKIFVSFGKAILYVFLFLGMQLVVSFAAMLVIIFKTTIEYAAVYGGNITDRDQMYIIDLATAELLENTMMLSIISGALTILFLVIFFAIRKKNLFSAVRFNRISVGNAVLCVILGIGLNFALSMLIGIIPFPQKWIDSYSNSAGTVTYGGVVAVFIASVLVAPLAEELVFRGLVFTRLRRALPQFAAMLITSAAFGAVHGTIIWFIYTFVLAMVMNFMYIRFNSLAASVLIHFGFNFAGIITSYLPELNEVLYIAYFVVCTICLAASIAIIILVAKITVENRVFIPEPEPVKLKYQPYPAYQGGYPLQYRVDQYQIYQSDTVESNEKLTSEPIDQIQDMTFDEKEDDK